MSTIRVIQTPPARFLGPSYRKQDWVGIELPIATKDDFLKFPPTYLSPDSAAHDDHLVLFTAGIKALRASGKKEAADLWERLPIGAYLQFPREVCEIVP